MRIFFMIIALLPYMACNAQNIFYNMISETVDKAFCEAVLYDNRNERVEIDDSFFPLEYKVSPLQKKYFYKKDYDSHITYIGGFNAILWKDSILLMTSRKNYYDYHIAGASRSLRARGARKRCYDFHIPPRRMFRTKDKIKNYYSSPYSPVLYSYTDGGKWERCAFPENLALKLENKENNLSCLQDFIDFALNESINNIIRVYPVNIDRILVLENTFGSDFFFHEYGFGKAFPYLVASERNMTTEDYNKYYMIFGWCEILLNDKTFTIVLRQVNGPNYVKKGLNEATRYKNIFDFVYSDKQDRWVCCKSQTIDNLYNTSTVKSY